MANTYSWKVANLERNVADGMVYTVHYTITANSDQVDPNSENGGFYSAGAYGSIGLEPCSPADMIPFDQLDEFTVASWVANSFGPEKVAEIEAALDAQIAEKIAPTKAAGVPW